MSLAVHYSACYGSRQSIEGQEEMGRKGGEINHAPASFWAAKVLSLPPTHSDQSPYPSAGRAFGSVKCEFGLKTKQNKTNIQLHILL